jgi:WXG100 family type VII secretion target
MSTFQVDSEAVLAHAAAARQTVGRIQGEVSALHAQLEQLQSSWTGGAASAFHGLVAEWRATQQRVEDNLATIGTALAQAGQQYAEIEQQNQRLFSSR